MQTIELQEGQSAIFGYGSLLLRSEIERTLGADYNGPLIACTIDGWFRTWDALARNEKEYYADSPRGRFYPKDIIYTNIIQRTGSLLNGALFVINDRDVKLFDKRERADRENPDERVYRHQDIRQALRGVTVTGSGEVFTYISDPKPSGSDPRQAAIRRTYLNTLENALNCWGRKFRREYELSTEPVPQELAIDDKRLNKPVEV